MRARRSVYFLFVFIFGFLLCIPLPGACASLNKPVCAVLTFHPDIKSAEHYESRYITNRYSTLLEQLDLYDVLSPDKVVERLKDSKWQMVDTCNGKECALEAGRIIGVDYIIYGVLGHIGKLYSMDTTLMDVKSSKIIANATTDFEGSRNDFANEAPPKNIRELLGISTNPPEWGKILAENTPEKEVVLPEPAPAEKDVRIGPRLGFGYSDNGVEVGLGFEVMKKNLSVKILGNNNGIATAFSYHVEPEGNTPYASLVGAYYKAAPHGIDEKGWIYGFLVGYRMYFMEKLDLCLGIGPGLANYHQTELNGNNKKDSGTTFLVIGEFTIGYMF
ncbi:MAG: hypothetical protein GXP53_03485 [Deltaproteobacteria bacterium]|nr:hypothetical protein [Deltaproteobacteria bacterium]